MVPAQRIEVVAEAKTAEIKAAQHAGGGEDKEKNSKHRHDLNHEIDQEVMASALDRSSDLLWEALNPALPALHIAINDSIRKTFIQGYKTDQQFQTVYVETLDAKDSRSLGKRFLQDEQGLLYFLNADFQPRLCIPKSEQSKIIAEAHESPLETAHMSAEQLWKNLTSKFYWR